MQSGSCSEISGHAVNEIGEEWIYEVSSYLGIPEMRSEKVRSIAELDSQDLMHGSVMLTENGG